MNGQAARAEAAESRSSLRSYEYPIKFELLRHKPAMVACIASQHILRSCTLNTRPPRF